MNVSCDYHIICTDLLVIVLWDWCIAVISIMTDLYVFNPSPDTKSFSGQKSGRCFTGWSFPVPGEQNQSHTRLSKPHLPLCSYTSSQPGVHGSTLYAIVAHMYCNTVCTLCWYVNLQFIVILTKHIHCPKRNLTQQGKIAVYSLDLTDYWTGLLDWITELDWPFVTKKLS